MLHCICRKLLFCAYAQSYACVASLVSISPPVLVVTSRTSPSFVLMSFFFSPSLRAKRLLYYRLMTLSPTNTPLVYLFFSPVISTRRRDATAPHVPRKKFVRPSHPIPSLCRTASLFSPPSRRPVACMPNRSLTPRIPRRAVPCTTPFFYRLLFLTSTYVRLPFFLLLYQCTQTCLSCRPLYIFFYFFIRSPD